MQLPLSMTVLICSACVASVPIPCLSIMAINSASVSRLGADVLPSTIVNAVGSNVWPVIAW